MRLTQDRLRIQSRRPHALDPLDLGPRESQCVGSDEGAGVHQMLPRQRDVQKGRSHEHQVEIVRRLFGQQSEQSVSPVLTGALRVVDDEVHDVVDSLEALADLGVGTHRVEETACEGEGAARSLAADDERIDHSLREEPGFSIRRSQSEPGEFVGAGCPFGDRRRLAVSARSADDAEVPPARRLDQRIVHTRSPHASRLSFRRAEAHSGYRTRQARGGGHALNLATGGISDKSMSP